MKEQLAAGNFTLADVFHLADEGSKAVTKTKVKAVLTALPKVGNVTANAGAGGTADPRRTGMSAALGCPPACGARRAVRLT
jgi:hypothetical protein